MDYNSQVWTDFSEAFAFLGNSLLATMHQTGETGLDSTFWERFPDFDDAHVKEALDSCATWAQRAQTAKTSGGDPAADASVEYTKLFVGPPSPAAAPWETFYRGEGAKVGFGEATFEMQRLLRESGLQVQNDNNQYADHIGIELLYLSVLCARMSQGGRAIDADGNELEPVTHERVVDFVNEHPLPWIGKLRAKVTQIYPEGYLAHLLALAEALLESLE